MRLGIVAALLVGLLTSCQEQEPAFVQSHCPYISGSLIQLHLFKDVEGVRVYTCCPGCLDEVEADPQDAIRRMHEQGVRPLSVAEAKHRDQTGALPSWARKSESPLWQKH